MITSAAHVSKEQNLAPQRRSSVSSQLPPALECTATTTLHHLLCSNCKELPVAAVTNCFSDWCQQCDAAVWATRPSTTTLHYPLCDNCKELPVAAVTNCFSDWCQQCDAGVWATRPLTPPPAVTPSAESDSSSPLGGEVTDASDPFEFQGRGTSHTHSLFCFSTSSPTPDVEVRPVRATKRCVVRTPLALQLEEGPVLDSEGSDIYYFDLFAHLIISNFHDTGDEENGDDNAEDDASLDGDVDDEVPDIMFALLYGPLGRPAPSVPPAAGATVGNSPLINFVNIEPGNRDPPMPAAPKRGRPPKQRPADPSLSFPSSPTSSPPPPTAAAKDTPHPRSATVWNTNKPPSLSIPPPGSSANRK